MAVTLDATTGELVAVSAPLTLTPADTLAYMESYENVCHQILGRNDIQRIGDGEFIKRSGWRKLGVWAMVSAEITEESEVRDELGALVRARFKVKATAPNGRTMDGIGVCDRSERRFSKPEHDIVATAHTRAINRAFADLFGLGAVSAEEMTESSGSETSHVGTRDAGRGAGSTPAAPAGDIDGVGELTAALAQAPMEVREAFKDWRRSRGLQYPPRTTEALRLMRAEYETLMERAAEERAAYGQ
jgi:hypothetical protein